MDDCVWLNWRTASEGGPYEGRGKTARKNGAPGTYPIWSAAVGAAAFEIVIGLQL